MSRHAAAVPPAVEEKSERTHGNGRNREAGKMLMTG